MVPAASSPLHDFIISVNGTPHKVPAKHGNLSLNEWIRTHAGVKSTKLGCGEGGCGACAVMISSTDPATGFSSWHSINSCLSPVYLAHGEDVLTAEGLPPVEEGAPTISERLVAFHASQCGFCTPGMAVACHATLSKCRDKGVAPTAEVMRDAVDSNLCRCTGYRPIVDACKSFARDVDIEDLGLSTYSREALAQLPCNSIAPITRGPYQAPRGGVERFQLDAGQVLVVPSTLEQLAEELGRPGAHLVAGNTSPGIYKDWPTHPLLVSITKVPELRSVTFDNGALVFGAAVTLSRLEEELQAAGEKVQMWREMAAHIHRIAGHHVRNAASVGGNVVLTRTRNLPSDMSTLLLAAGGEVTLLGPSDAQDGAKTRQTLTLDQFLNPGFGSPALDVLPSGGSLLLHFRVPEGQVSSSRFWSTRLAHRYANSASDLNAALKLTFDGSTVSSARFALGFDEGSTHGHLGVWHLIRAQGVEAGLRGLTSDQLHRPETAKKLVAALAADVGPALGAKLKQGDHRARYLLSAAEGCLRQALAALGRAGGAEHAANGADGGSTAQVANGTNGTTEAGKHVDGHSNGVGGGLGAQEGSGYGRGGCNLPAKLPKPAVMCGRQRYAEPDHAVAPLTVPVAKTGALMQAAGTAVYSDDVPIEKDALFAAFVYATQGNARLVGIDASKALQLPGVRAFVSGKDIPGTNVGMSLFNYQDPGAEPLFATEEVQYYGQPLGLILADSYQAAVHAAKRVEVQYDTQGRTVLTNIQTAVEAGSYYPLPKLLPHLAPGTSAGGNSVVVQSPNVDMEAALAAAPLLDKGAKYSLPAQTHMYMEPQTAVVRMDEDGMVRAVASCQALESSQYVVAKALNLPLNKVNVTTRRMGGAYGGKFTHTQKVVGAAAVAAYVTKKQVRLAVERCTDFTMFAGRMQTEVEYSVGYDADGLVHAVDMKVVLQAGAYQDAAFMEVFVLSSSPDTVYYVPALRAEFIQVRTNTPCRTAVRGPGEIQVQLIMENIIEHVAARTGLDPAVVRGRNMLHARQPKVDKGVAAAGQREEATGAPAGAPVEGAGVEGAVGDGKSKRDKAEGVLLTGLGKQVNARMFTLPRIWEQLQRDKQYDQLVERVRAFNAENRWRKRGVSLVPCKYSLGGGKKVAMVSVYADGSVLVAHSGTEMGQGLITKVIQAAAYALSQALSPGAEPFPLNLIRTTDTSSLSLPYFSLTGGSTTSEGACEAVRVACAQLVEKLAPLAESKRKPDGPPLTWRELAAAAFSMGMPWVGFPPGVPMIAFAEGELRNGDKGYTTYGAALAEVEVDVLTGDRQVLSVDVLFDAGKTLNPAIDVGQVEGAFTHGMGALLLESHEVHAHDGSPATATTWKYKVPGVYCMPQQFNIELLKDSELPGEGAISCKSVGEPPLLLSSCVLLALQQAAAAAAAAQHADEAPGAVDGGRINGGVNGGVNGALGTNGAASGHTMRAYKPLCAPATSEAIRAYIGY